MEKLTLLKAIQTHLMLPGEGASVLAAQYRQLNDKDKTDLREWFPQSGVCEIV